jgi:hypothetical protein
VGEPESRSPPEHIAATTFAVGSGVRGGEEEEEEEEERERDRDLER